MAYSDEQRATALAALDANGGNLLRTAKETRIPRQTLQDWAAGRKPNGAAAAVMPEKRQRKREDLAGALDEIAWRCVDLLPEKLENADARQVATTLGIAVEKAALLRREPTCINETRGTELTDEERIELVREMLATAQARTTGETRVN